jgi:hypothetical protein
MAKWMLGASVVGYVALGDFEGTYEEALAAARERMTPELLAAQGDEDLCWGDVDRRLRVTTQEERAAIMAACEVKKSAG